MKLEKYISDNGLSAKIIDNEVPVGTVEESTKVLKCEASDIVKSIVIVTNKGEYFLVILQGDRKIKTKKVKKLLEVKDLKLAPPKEVKDITGYDVGDVPPISVNLPTIIDELVITRKKLYAGGGGPTKTLQIIVDELLDCTHPLIADVSIPL